MTGNNVAASIRQRLLNHAKETGENFDLVLTHYGIQRTLYRLSQSEYKERFLLKGAWLFAIWQGEMHRPTKDVDLLGFGDNDQATLLAVFNEILELETEEQDGLVFDVNSLKAEDIKEDDLYQGIRIKCKASLDKAQITIQIDIGYGDAVTPSAKTELLPSLLDFAPVELNAYPVYTVIAEKFQAMVELGIANSRMKDFYDIWQILQTWELEYVSLVAAIQATFACRKTQLDAAPLFVFSREFILMKQTQWQAFCRKNNLEKIAFEHVVGLIAKCLSAVQQGLGQTGRKEKYWSPSVCEWRDQ